MLCALITEVIYKQLLFLLKETAGHDIVCTAIGQFVVNTVVFFWTKVFDMGSHETESSAGSTP